MRITEKELVKVAGEVIGVKLEDKQPIRSGEWVVWEQFASRGLMQRYVKQLKDAGIPAFLNGRDFGIRKS